MGRRSGVLLIISLFFIGSFAPLGASDGGGSDRGLEFLDDEYPAWIDTFDDMSKVYVPIVGLVGVEVAGGEVNLLPGRTTGWVASITISPPEGHRYDYVQLNAQTPGNSSIQISILDPSKDTTKIGYANETIANHFDIDGKALSLYGLDKQTYPEIRIQASLFADGADAPRLLAWEVVFCDVEQWHDPFIGIGRDSAHGNLHLGDGAVRPVDPIVSGGLKGSYYDNMDLTGFRYSNPHEVVDFDWGYGGPAGLGSNSFSIRWDGFVRISKAESYTFYVRSDDGSRLWIDGQLKIDEWVDQAPTEHSTTLHLEPGYYGIRLEYYENSLSALCEFRYSSSSIVKKIVPSEVLYAGGISNLISEPIGVPQGYKWDLILIDRTEGADGRIFVDVLDTRSNTTISGLSDILGDHVDLTTLDPERYPSIQLKARWNTTNVTQAPALSHWVVKWMPMGMWREQFYVEARAERLVNMVVENGTAASTGWTHTAPTLLFAGLFDDAGGSAESYAFLDSGGLDYLSKAPVALGVQGASSLDAEDVNGDGYLDVVFAVYRTSSSDYSASSPLFLGSAVGLLPEPYRTFPTVGAQGVVLDDLNGDGYVDVVFAQEQDGGDYFINSTLFWGSDSGWNSTPDVNFTSRGATGVSAADVDADGDLDLVFSCYKAASTATDSMVFIQGPSGFDGSSPTYRLPTKGARAVAVGDLDDDTFVDIVFANSFSTGFTEIDSFIYWGKAGGGFETTPEDLPTIGAQDVELADLNEDGDLDIVFANGANNIDKHEVDSYVYMNDLSRNFPSVPDATLPTIGAHGVAAGDLDGSGMMDLVFASFKNDSTHKVPSLVYLGNSSGWSTSPNVELPTEGASDVLIPRDSSAGTGGYMSKPITPEDPTETGTFHTFGYTVNPDAPKTGTVQLIDANTYEVLAETTLGSGVREWTVENIFTVRDHPSVRVMIVVEGLDLPDGFWLDDLWLNWTPRIKLAPIVLDMGVDASSIYRTEGTDLWVNVSDEYDPIPDLVLSIEHRLNGTEDTWETTLVSATDPLEDVIHVVITSRIGTPTGMYDFRARVTDTDGIVSAVVYFPMVLEVLNNIPSTPEVRITPLTAVTTSTLKVDIITSATDVESSGLQYHFKWFKDGEPVPNATGETLSSFYTSKGQNWSVEVRAFDGEDEGLPATAWMIIENAPPQPKDDLPDPEFEEDTTDTNWLDLSTAFEDPDGDPLTWSLETPAQNLGVTIDPMTGQVTLTPASDWFGEEVITFVATDGEHSAFQSVTVHVVPVNDIPSIATVDGEPVVGDTITYTIRQGELLEIRFEVADKEGDEVIATVNSSMVTLDEVARLITFQADNEAVGTLRFGLRIYDVASPNERVSLNFIIIIENENDPMEMPEIKSPGIGESFKVNQSFSLVGMCEDPDIQYGQVLNYTWESSISGLLGYGSSLTVSIMEPGKHTITLTVRDPDYAKNVSVDVEIKPLDDVTPPPPPVDDDEPLKINWALIVAIIAVLGILGAVFFVVVGKQKTEDYEEQMDAEMHEEEKREALKRTAAAIKDVADAWETERDWEEEDSTGDFEEIAVEADSVPSSQLTMEAKVTEAASKDTEKLWTGVSGAAAEQSEEEKEALRLDNLKRQYQNAIGRLPYGIPSKELADRDWVDLANALATGERKTLPDGREVTDIDGRWYYSDREDTGTFLKEHGAKPKRAEPKRRAEPETDKDALLSKLQERFIMGEITEESYKELKRKYGGE
jgi:FlaG/FlaF family flagellin (archaellin)